LIVHQAVLADDISTEFQQPHRNNATLRFIHAKECEEKYEKERQL
jgi:hypothetical protein